MPFLHPTVTNERATAGSGLGASPQAQLRPREQQTLELLLAGMPAKQIADRLGISVHTANQYTKSIFRCFGVGSRAALLARLLGRGASTAAGG